jgi:GNAT superfamily N-acetyltransferase
VNESVTIRRAGHDDLDQAWRIVSEYYDAVDVQVRDAREAFPRLYFSDGAGIWLAESASGPTESTSRVVGCIALRPLPAPSLPARPGDIAAGEVKRLYVQPAWRGHGIAALLLASLENYAAAAGYGWLYLDSKDDLPTAIRFYEKRGYIRCGRYNENPQATVFMRKRLLRT